MTYELTVLASHPVQYQAPLFRKLADEPEIDLRVLYMWEEGIGEKYDPGFDQEVEWDVPVLEGYDWDVLSNWGRSDGPESFFGLVNPGVVSHLVSGEPDGVLVEGWSNVTNWLAAALGRLTDVDLLFRAETVARTEQNASGMLRNKAIRGFISSFDAVFPIGTSSQAFYDLFDYPEERRFLTPYAVDNEFFFAQAERYRGQREEILTSIDLDPDLPVVLFVAKLIPRKRPGDLLEALAPLEGEVQGVFVGDGELRGELEARASDLDHIAFVGFQNQTELPRWYAAADIFVLPSAFETWGLVVNEAMCFELPVITTHEVTSSLDLVEGVRTGFRYPVGDTESLRDLLERLGSNEGLRRELGERARKRVKEWSMEACLDGFVSGIRFLSGNKGPGGGLSPG